MNKDIILQLKGKLLDSNNLDALTYIKELEDELHTIREVNKSLVVEMKHQKTMTFYQCDKYN